MSLVDDQLVHVRERGLLPVQRVLGGEHVLSHSGYWNTVRTVKRRQHRKLLTEIIYYRWSEPLYCTHDTQLLLKRNTADPIWTEAHHVLPGDFLCMPRPLHTARLTELIVPDSCRLPLMHANTKRLLTSEQRADAIARYAPWGRGGVSAADLAKEYGVSYGTIMRELAGRGDWEPQIKRRVHPLPPTMTVDDDVLHMLGWYLAEGWATIAPGKGHFVGFAGHKDERPVLERIAACLHTRCWLTTMMDKSSAGNGMELRVYSHELAAWFAGWLGTGARTKALPAELLDLPADQAHVLLAAYTAGDGYRRNRQHEWISVSGTLASQMALLALRCGHAPTLRQIHGSKNDGTWVGCYTVDGRPDNKALRCCDDRFVYQPVRAVTTRFAPKVTYVTTLTVDAAASLVVGQAAIAAAS
jgi:hypothetical protein